MRPRGRPKRVRKIKKGPKIFVFSPRGRPGRPDEVDLKYEELEALRLADFGNNRQKEAANRMGISRQSFGRVLHRARKTVADALVNGKIIRVTGGCYKLASQRRVESKTHTGK